VTVMNSAELLKYLKTGNLPMLIPLLQTTAE